VSHPGREYEQPWPWQLWQPWQLYAVADRVPLIQQAG
jgi:hypothetical protein